MQPYLKSSIAFLWLLTVINVYAQKQPQIQIGSVRAPSNLRVDGKLNEWPNKLLNAYNQASRIYYVVSNDDSTLYLTVRGLGTRVAWKALQSGMTFTVSHVFDKKMKANATGNVAIVFPEAIEKNAVNNILGPQRSLSNYMDDTLANKTQIDSLVAISNKRLSEAVREFKVIGVKEITDSVISIYNTTGIKAQMRFSRLAPIIEFGIPLKYLGLSVKGVDKFSYNIKLAGVSTQQPGTFPTPVIMDENGLPAPPDPGLYYLENPVDFWGEYILAKKP